MDTRTDFQRLLEDMDKVIKRKQEELAELDERLEIAHEELSKSEANKLLEEQKRRNSLEDDDDDSPDRDQREANEDYLKQQQLVYEENLAQINAELLELEQANKELEKNVERLEIEKESMRLSNERLASKMQLLLKNYDQVKSANLELNMRLARAESESQMQQQLMKKSHEQDQILMDAFNDKLESLKRDLASKDEEIRRLRLDDRLTLESLGVSIDLNGIPEAQGAFEQRDKLSSSMEFVDSNKKQKIIEIASLLREKDEQIDLLKSQLIEATLELENNANILEQSVKKVERENWNGDLGSVCDNCSRCDLMGENKSLFMKERQMLESELEAKDKQLHQNEQRLRYFESILPQKIPRLIEELFDSYQRARKMNQEANLDRSRIDELTHSLNRALNEINTTKFLLDKNEQFELILSAKDKQIERLVRELNELADEAGNRDLYIQDDRDKSSEMDNTHPREEESTKEIPTSSEQNCDTTQGSRTGPPTGEVKEVAEPIDEKKQLEDKAPLKAPRPRTRLLSTSRDLTERRALNYEESRAELDKKMRQLERENQLLELGMKEILLLIKGFDLQCDSLLIDCPSLERLCLLMESRYVVKANQAAQRGQAVESSTSKSEDSDRDLFQLVVLKSELDLLRGQNEQLRSELRMSRMELHDMLASNVENISQTMETTEDQPAKISHGEPGEEDADEKLNEVEVEESPSRETKNADSTEKDSSQSDDQKLCQNCSRLTKFVQHLLECIARIESRVISNDESNLNRLASMYKLIQQMGEDLSRKESTCAKLRTQSNSLTKRNLILEARCHALESRIDLHSKVCPLNSLGVARRINGNGSSRIKPDNPVAIQRSAIASIPSTNFRYTELSRSKETAITNGHDITTTHKRASVSHSSLTISNEMHRSSSLNDNRMAVTLLHSIIGCLQARLESKDERLNQLEQTTNCADISSIN